MAEEQVGRVTHYFGKIGVVAIEVTDGVLSVGDTVRIKGHTSDLLLVVDSMQLDNAAVEQASPGQVVGMKVAEHAREHDIVYKVTE